MRALRRGAIFLQLLVLTRPLSFYFVPSAFQVNTGSTLAVRYNDASVLENHHAACGWAALQRARLLAPLPADEARALRRVMVSAILATDMSAHKTLLAGIEARLTAAPGDDGVRVSGDDAEGTPHAGSFSRDSAEDRQLLVAFVLHCADLHNPLLPPQLSRRIADDLGREFAAQAEQERRAGLPITVMLADSDAAKARMEIGFLDYGAFCSAEHCKACGFQPANSRACFLSLRSCSPSLRHAGAHQPGHGRLLRDARGRKPSGLGGGGKRQGDLEHYAPPPHTLSTLQV